ncbi:MAG: hypothetical protein HC859_15305 [Bacteroidia bacterium]|nr:hypothetical protein [Bacteroidia bacterium]
MKTAITYFQAAAAGVLLMLLASCNKKPATADSPEFTKIDSLTETYLEFQDSLLIAWNHMINDDNDKITAMRNLLHELTVTNQFNKEELAHLEERLHNLSRFRYTQKSIGHEGLVEEYDFASAALVTEIIGLAESHTAYTYNNVMQALVKEIYESDRRVERYRTAYDSLARQYNTFLERNKAHMKEIDLSNALEKRPLFEMTSDSN